MLLLLILTTLLLPLPGSSETLAVLQQASPAALPPDEAITLVRMQMFFTGLTLAFGLLHLILFAILPYLRSNLYYALFLFFYAAAIFLDFQAALWLDTAAEVRSLSAQRIVLSLSLIFGLRFFYELFRSKSPRWFPLFALGMLAAGLYAATDPMDRAWTAPDLCFRKWPRSRPRLFSHTCAAPAGPGAAPVRPTTTSRCSCSR